MRRPFLILPLLLCVCLLSACPAAPSGPCGPFSPGGRAQEQGVVGTKLDVKVAVPGVSLCDWAPASRAVVKLKNPQGEPVEAVTRFEPGVPDAGLSPYGLGNLGAAWVSFTPTEPGWYELEVQFEPGWGTVFSSIFAFTKVPAPAAVPELTDARLTSCANLQQSESGLWFCDSTAVMRDGGSLRLDGSVRVVGNTVWLHGPSEVARFDVTDGGLASAGVVAIETHPSDEPLLASENALWIIKRLGQRVDRFESSSDGGIAKTASMDAGRTVARPVFAAEDAVFVARTVQVSTENGGFETGTEVCALKVSSPEQPECGRYPGELYASSPQGFLTYSSVDRVLHQAVFEQGQLRLKSRTTLPSQLQCNDFNCRLTLDRDYGAIPHFTDLTARNPVDADQGVYPVIVPRASGDAGLVLERYPFGVNAAGRANQRFVWARDGNQWLVYRRP